MSEQVSAEEYRHALRKLLAGWNILMKLAINVPSEQRRTAMLVMGWVAQCIATDGRFYSSRRSDWNTKAILWFGQRLSTP